MEYIFYFILIFTLNTTGCPVPRISSGVYRLRTEALSFQNVVFVLKIVDNGKSPCESW